jgi:hypothetical protein
MLTLGADASWPKDIAFSTNHSETGTSPRRTTFEIIFDELRYFGVVTKVICYSLSLNLSILQSIFMEEPVG